MSNAPREYLPKWYDLTHIFIAEWGMLVILGAWGAMGDTVSGFWFATLYCMQLMYFGARSRHFVDMQSKQSDEMLEVMERQSQQNISLTIQNTELVAQLQAQKNPHEAG